MKIRPFEEPKTELPLLKVGDIVEASHDFYIVGFEGVSEGAYVLRNLNTSFYANGTFHSLRALTNSVENKGWKVYAKKDYELQLVRKGS